MAGISSKAAGKLENKMKYDGYELNSYFDINLCESFYRSHDPQLGRFWQIDPSPNESFSLYSAMNNNPILFNDLLGDTAKFDATTQVMVDKYTKQTTTNKNGKEVRNKNYNAAFAGMISKIDAQSTADGYNVNYSYDANAKEGATTSDGVNVNVTINDLGPSFGGGADGVLFEETKHVDQFLDGKATFEKQSNGRFKAASNIQNEVEAKQFAIDNLPISNFYRSPEGLDVPTQLGFLKKAKDYATKANFLLNGASNINVSGIDKNHNSISGNVTIPAPYPGMPSTIINPPTIFTRNDTLFGYPHR